MKQVLFILLLAIGSLRAQVAAPDLRCLEVLSNGNVKLTWIPPADPNNLFFSYEIFASNIATGPFTQVGTVGALVTNTFVHNGNANNTSLYYLMQTKFGSAGVNTSEHSDTLRSIFLNLIPGAVDIKLVYNHLKQPKLPSSGSTFTIWKEYPLGTWNIFTSTDNLLYQDTLVVCTDSLSYQVTLPDNSGCVSISNIQTGSFTDQKPPNEPYVDSISVLPNGQTVIAWRVPRDIDIEKYWILEKPPGGTNNYIDTVPGRLSTIYTYTSTAALTRPVQLFVAAEDSCNNISTFNIDPITMFLQADYDICAYSTALSWNQYQGMHKGVAEYRIYYSVNGAAFNQIGNTTATTFTHTNVQEGKNICYFVRVINTEGLITASSNRTCFFSRQVKAPAYVYMKNATVISDNSIRINVLLDTSVVSTGVEIQRSVTGSDFFKVGFTPYNNTRHYTFVDTAVQTNLSSYYYKAIVRDSCGNIRNQSNVSRTMLLSVKQDPEMMFTEHLSWNAYQGYGGGLSGYNIYRVVNEEPETVPVGFADSQTTTFTDDLEDEAAVGARIDYVIEAVEGISNPYGLQLRSNSNPVSVYIEGTVYVPNSFAPQGVNKTWLPVTHFVDKSEYSVKVFNRWGAKVFETDRDDVAWDGGNLPSGIFAYLISYKNSRGEYLQQTGYVYLLR